MPTKVGGDPVQASPGHTQHEVPQHPSQICARNELAQANPAEYSSLLEAYRGPHVPRV
jgi:hypothetical protein